jgi:large subunit ribosomal protein L23
MALFSRSKKIEESAVEKTVSTQAVQARATNANLSSVIVKPRITEKAVRLGEENVYTFVVRRDATKRDVVAAIKALYNVTPVNVNIVNKTPRQYKSKAKNRVLTEKGMKKAYVYVKKGDSISLV